MVITLTMAQYREFAEKFPEADRYLTRLSLIDEYESLKRRGRKNLLNIMDLKRMNNIEIIMNKEEVPA
jgi:hypothetical protein